MKKTKVFSDSKIMGALAAIASGIITELIYDIVSTSHFEITTSDKINLFHIVEINNYNTLHRIAIVLIIFCMAWILMAIAIPQVITFIKVRKIHTKKVLTAKQVSHEYYDIKGTILDLFNEFIRSDFFLCDDVEKNSESINKYLFAYREDIAVCINRLYNIFKCSGSKKEQIIDSAFRAEGDIGLAGRYISKKDYSNLINILEDLLTCFSKNQTANKKQSNSELIDDYTKLWEELNYLKQIRAYEDFDMLTN